VILLRRARHRRRERLLRALLHQTANTVTPSLDGLARIHDRIHNKSGAPGVQPGTPRSTNGWKEPKAMPIMRPVEQLRPDDVIVRHPDHPDRTVHYRVSRWPKSLDNGEVIVDYTEPAADGHGPSLGVLCVPRGHLCHIEPGPAAGQAVI